jgi:hypothetical protein
MQFDASSAECLIFTFREGWLSAMGHDLKIRVGKFSIAADETTRAVDACFDAGSLRVVCAVRNGQDDPGALTIANKKEIEQNIRRAGLDAARHPEIRFVSSSVEEEQGGGDLVRGRLTIRGRQRQIGVRFEGRGERYVGDVWLHQPDFGIQPYSAMLGALRVHADVRVQISVPVPR